MGLEAAWGVAPEESSGRGGGGGVCLFSEDSLVDRVCCEAQQKQGFGCGERAWSRGSPEQLGGRKNLLAWKKPAPGLADTKSVPK